jgi:hypothetical protein
MQKMLLAERTSVTHKGNRWRGWWVVVARTAYMVLTGTAIFLFVFSLPVYFTQMQIICPTLPGCSFTGQLSRGTLPWFQSAHISVSAYAASLLALATIHALLSLVIGIVIVWRLWGKSNEVLGLLTSFVLILGGTIANANGDFTNFSPASPLFIDIVGAIGFFLYWPALGMILLTFPTGRFAPRWTWIVILLWIIQIPLYGLLAHEASPLLFAAERLLVWGSSFAVLYWRYRHLYSHVQRQQTKWLLYGFVPFYLLYLLYGALQSIPALNTPDSLYLVVGPILILLVHIIVPLAVGIALLRYRLWDVDLLIKRTLVYGTLSVSLVLIYVGLIIGLQALVSALTGQISQSPVVIVISTLAIAALFQPLRHRIQNIIDRRFYRSKYDAARTLAAFSATLRDEVDLEQLRDHLLAVVQETMQPAHVSLWLRQPQHPEKPSEHMPS